MQHKTYTLKDLIDVVRESRMKTNPYYPMPDIEKSFRFAFTECGEFEDALLRKEPGFVRNNSKEVNARAEYGQVGYMIATAMFQLVDDPEHSYDNMDYTRRIHYVTRPNDEDVYDVVVFLINAIRREEYAHDTLSAWANSCYGYGCDPMELLIETCKAVEEKRIPAKENE